MSSPVPYLGSKISLISKSEIRYEGILYTIDAQESIIALAKVKSFGTEDRPVELHVPARDDVYEYIIFRGTDIKKIEVCEAPKQPMVALHNDPAIVQASSFGGVRHSLGPIGGGAPPPPTYAGYPQNLGQQPMGAPAAPSFMAAATSAQPTLAEMLGSRSPTPTQLVAAAAAVASRKSPVSDASVQVSPPPQENKRKSVSKEPNKHGNEDHDSRVNRRDGQGYNNARRNNQYNNFGQGYGYNHGYNQGFRNHGYQNHFYGGYMGRGGMGRGGGMMNRGGPGGGRRMRGGHMGRGGGTGILQVNANRQKEDKALFQEDYDFELANNKFEELRSKMSNTKIGPSTEENSVAPVIPAEPTTEESLEEKEKKVKENDETDENQQICYDKTKSFFDSISCEAIERSMGRSQRPDWRHERKINQETFGVSSARRGGGVGYYNRGRGGYFSRGGGGNFYRGGGYNQGYYRGGNYRGGGAGGSGYSNRGNSNKNNPTTNGTANKAPAPGDKPIARPPHDTVANA